jgi:hypothetical protein
VAAVLQAVVAVAAVAEAGSSIHIEPIMSAELFTQWDVEHTTGFTPSKAYGHNLYRL